MEKILQRKNNSMESSNYTIEIFTTILGVTLYLIFTDGSGFYLLSIDWMAYLFSALEMAIVTVVVAFLSTVGKKLGEKIWKKYGEKEKKTMAKHEHDDL